jgi:hypothetical protein
VQSSGKPGGGKTTMPPRTDSGGTTGIGGTSSGGPSKCGAILPATRADYHAPATCDYLESEVVGLVPDAAELNELLIGQWLLCSASFFRTQDDVGFEVTPDLRWHTLLLDGAGGLIPATAPESRGTVEEIDLGGYMQLNLMSSLGTRISLPQFARVPLKMRLEQTDPQLGEYVKNEPAGLCVAAAAAPPTGPYEVPSACSAASIPMASPNSLAGAQSALIGRWQTCGGSIFYQSDDVGFELYPDGGFGKLYPDSSGTVFAGQGFDREGSYQISLNGDSVQLELNVHGAGPVLIMPEFRYEPRSIEVEIGFDRVRFVYMGDGEQ